MRGIALAEGMAACSLGRRQQLLCSKYRAFSDFAGNPPSLFRAKRGSVFSNSAADATLDACGARPAL